MTEELNEVYLSRVLGKTVINEKGLEIGTLDDLVMAPGEVFPEVSHLIVRNRKRKIAIPWRLISLFNRFVISVDRTSTEFPRHESPEGEILVKRDILATMIGFNYGANLCLFPAFIKDLCGLTHFGVNYGILFTSWGIGGLSLAGFSRCLRRPAVIFDPPS